MPRGCCVARYRPRYRPTGRHTLDAMSWTDRWATRACQHKRATQRCPVFPVVETRQQSGDSCAWDTPCRRILGRQGARPGGSSAHWHTALHIAICTACVHIGTAYEGVVSDLSTSHRPSSLLLHTIPRRWSHRAHALKHEARQAKV